MNVFVFVADPNFHWLSVWQWQPILCCGCLDFWRNIWEFKQNKFCESQSHHMRRQLASFKCESYLQINYRLIRGGNWRRRFRHKRRQLRSFLTSSCWGSRSTTAGWTESGRDRGQDEEKLRDMAETWLGTSSSVWRLRSANSDMSNCPIANENSYTAYIGTCNTFKYLREMNWYSPKKVKAVGCTVSINLTKKHVSLTF